MPKSKVVKYLCGSIAIVCIVILIALTLQLASSKHVIGGAGLPTFLFSLRQTVSSPPGIVVSVSGILSLIVLLVLSVKGRH